MPENVRETRYQEVILVDAIDATGKTVQVIDERQSRIFTEAQAIAELESAEAIVVKKQAVVDAITALKEA